MKNLTNQPRHLLIIEDDNICTFLNTKVAETSGIFKEIRSVANGKDALDFFDQVSKGTAPTPDVILLDLNMPVMNGFDFLQALQEIAFPNKERLSIIALSSSVNMVDKYRAFSLGIRHYVQKPLTLNNLQTAIFSLGNNDLEAVSNKQ